MATDQQPEAILVQHPTEPWGLVIKVQRTGSDPELTQAERLILALRTQVESLQDEVNEQARLNGMGAERELALMAKVEILQAASVEWSPAYTRGPARQSAPVAAVPAMVPLTEEHMVSAVRPLCNTDQVAERLVAVSVDEYRAIEAAIAKINGLTVGDGAQPIKGTP